MNDAILNKVQMLAEQNITDIENFKKDGRKVVGLYCLYSPVELVVAANGIPLTLCGTKNDPITVAEEKLPRNLCPLIKSSYGFALSGTCPFFNFADFIVADTTCDGKKKMFELMQEIKPVHVLQLPQNQEKSSSLPLFRGEVEKMKSLIEHETKNEITDDKIKNAISLMNRERKAKKELMDLAKLTPSPITGTELITILFKTGFFANKEKGIEMLNDITSEYIKIHGKKKGPYNDKTKRILLTGVPVGLGSDKIIRIVEESGGSIVCFENCSGYKQAFTVNEEEDPITALAKQYLEIPCSVMSPNQKRFDLLDEMIEGFSVDGIIDLTWQACHTYNIEAFKIAEVFQKEKKNPLLHLETDYSETDSEQLRVRIEAFLEMI